MTLNEAKELFPSVSFDAPENAVGYIYITVEVAGERFYIGKQLKKKWNKDYFGGGRNPREWVRQGLELVHWPIQWCYSREELNKSEWTWIDKFKNRKDIANLIEGGTGGRHSGSAKIISDEYSQRRSDMVSGEKNPFYGKKHTEETKKAISEKHKQLMLDPENRKKYSEALKEYYKTHESPMKGYHYSEEVKKRISENNKEYYKTHDAPFKGRNHNEDAKTSMSERKIELFKKERTDYVPCESTAFNARSVKCVETGEIFSSTKEAQRAFGGKSNHIKEVCDGHRRTCMGYHWIWAEGDCNGPDKTTE